MTKREMWIRPIVTTAILTILLGAAAWAAPENLIENPGFEDGMKPWRPRTMENCGPNHEIDKQVKHSGDASGRVDKSGYYYSDYVPASEGDWFKGIFWAKVTQGTKAGCLIYFWDAKRKLAGYDRGPVVDGEKWAQYEFMARAPENAKFATLALTYRAEGSAWFDDAEMTRILSGETGLLVPNGGFEDGMEPWRPRTAQNSGPNHRIDTETKHGGQASARIDKQGYYYSPDLQLPAGTKIQATFWAKVAPGKGGTCNFYVFRKGQKPQRLELKTVPPGDWSQVETSFIVPEGAERVTFAMNYTGGATAWFDDVELKEIAP